MHCYSLCSTSETCLLESAFMSLCYEVKAHPSNGLNFLVMTAKNWHYGSLIPRPSHVFQCTWKKSGKPGRFSDVMMTHLPPFVQTVAEMYGMPNVTQVRIVEPSDSDAILRRVTRRYIASGCWLRLTSQIQTLYCVGITRRYIITSE